MGAFQIFLIPQEKSSKSPIGALSATRSLSSFGAEKPGYFRRGPNQLHLFPGEKLPPVKPIYFFRPYLYHEPPFNPWKNKGFGHLKTRLFTIKTSKNVGFGAIFIGGAKGSTPCDSGPRWMNLGVLGSRKLPRSHVMRHRAPSNYPWSA